MRIETTRARPNKLKIMPMINSYIIIMNDFCYISSISRMYLLPSKALTEILSPLHEKSRNVCYAILENCIVSDIVILEALSKVGEMDYFDEFLRSAQPWSIGPYNPIRHHQLLERTDEYRKYSI